MLHSGLISYGVLSKMALHREGHFCCSITEVLWGNTLSFVLKAKENYNVTEKNTLFIYLTIVNEINYKGLT